jgi:hypothetical protein
METPIDISRRAAQLLRVPSPSLPSRDRSRDYEEHYSPSKNFNASSASFPAPSTAPVAFSTPPLASTLFLPETSMLFLETSALFLPASELTLDVEAVTGAGFVVLAFAEEGAETACSGGGEGGTSSTEKSRSSRNWRASSAFDLGLGAMKVCRWAEGFCRDDGRDERRREDPELRVALDLFAGVEPSLFIDFCTWPGIA